eukprot:TRINITY_DN0_c823_g1_i4.p2 TRINITY_DN0_c823_g1~~TRINITY_DN0_c823_g1_i4.p2  ORF type:complete len:108 (-),score=3.17 TRINITY_DN0_c823_g1_i4:89-412(-)
MSPATCLPKLTTKLLKDMDNPTSFNQTMDNHLQLTVKQLLLSLSTPDLSLLLAATKSGRCSVEHCFSEICICFAKDIYNPLDVCVMFGCSEFNHFIFAILISDINNA